MTTILDVASHLIRQRETPCAAPEFITAYLVYAANEQYDRTVAGVSDVLRRYCDSPCHNCGGPIGLHPWTTYDGVGLARSFCSRLCMDAREVFGTGSVRNWRAA